MSEKRAQYLRTAFISGALSGTVSTLLFQPLDLVKTRIQINKQQRSTSLYKIFREVLRREKIQGLWRGTVPSLYRTVPGIGVYYGALHIMHTRLRGNLNHFKRFAMGATARGSAVLLLMPVNVIKVRFESGKFHYKTVPAAFRDIWLNEGVKGLYRGISSTMFRDVPYSGVYLMVYCEIKNIVKKSVKAEKLNTPMFAFCGLLSGVCACLVTHPPDVVKTHIQASVEPFSNATIFCNIYKENGVQGYFKGFVPRTLRRTLMSAMTWTIYEKLMAVVGIK